MWLAEAEYSDGTFITRLFSSGFIGNQSEEQFRLEEWLINRHDDITWYSVMYVED